MSVVIRRATMCEYLKKKCVHTFQTLNVFVEDSFRTHSAEEDEFWSNEHQG